MIEGITKVSGKPQQFRRTMMLSQIILAISINPWIIGFSCWLRKLSEGVMVRVVNYSFVNCLGANCPMGSVVPNRIAPWVFANARQS